MYGPFSGENMKQGSIVHADDEQLKYWRFPMRARLDRTTNGTHPEFAGVRDRSEQSEKSIYSVPKWPFSDLLI